MFLSTTTALFLHLFPCTFLFALGKIQSFVHAAEILFELLQMKLDHLVRVCLSEAFPERLGTSLLDFLECGAKHGLYFCLQIQDVGLLVNDLKWDEYYCVPCASTLFHYLISNCAVLVFVRSDLEPAFVLQILTLGPGRTAQIITASLKVTLNLALLKVKKKEVSLY